MSEKVKDYKRKEALHSFFLNPLSFAGELFLFGEVFFLGKSSQVTGLRVSMNKPLHPLEHLDFTLP